MPRSNSTVNSARFAPGSRLRRSYLDQTARVVAAYVSKNSVSAIELPKIIGEVHAALADLEGSPATPRKPAVPIKTSVTKNSIHCLEDGKVFRSIKRHLKTSHDLTPDQYRQKWGLSAHYPMVAPAYSFARSELAKQMGLGRKPRARRGKTAR